MIFNNLHRMINSIVSAGCVIYFCTKITLNYSFTFETLCCYMFTERTCRVWFQRWSLCLRGPQFAVPLAAHSTAMMLTTVASRRRRRPSAVQTTIRSTLPSRRTSAASLGARRNETGARVTWHSSRRRAPASVQQTVCPPPSHHLRRSPSRLRRPSSSARLPTISVARGRQQRGPLTAGLSFRSAGKLYDLCSRRTTQIPHL